MKSNSKETNRIKEPSKFAIKFANTVFVLGILFSVLVTVYAVYKIYNKPVYITSTFYFSFLLFAVLSAALFVLGLRKLRDEFKMNLSVLLITVGILVYGFETYLEFSSYEGPQSEIAIAEQMGVPYDIRSKRKVLMDLRKAGIDAHPNFRQHEFHSGLFSLAGISNITTFLTNESGYYPIIETDEHGFNNPKGLYQINKVDIALTGDSFTEGYSVHADETISAVLRESGFNTISLGKGGYGPLLVLATIKEYAEYLKPKVVIWQYYTPYFGRLNDELNSQVLIKYLNDKEFSQNLILRQEEIDGLIKELSEIKFYSPWHRMIKFSNLRNRLKIKPSRRLDEPPPSNRDTQQEIFKKILQQAKKMVSMWDGMMYFVYLAEFSQYSKGIEDINREYVLHTANELGIPIIDIHKEVFVPHSDPLSLFPFRRGGHYNAEGYRLVAESISKRLKADGIIPLN